MRGSLRIHGCMSDQGSFGTSYACEAIASNCYATYGVSHPTTAASSSGTVSWAAGTIGAYSPPPDLVPEFRTVWTWNKVASEVLHDGSGSRKGMRFTEEQIAYALRQAESGTPVADVCRQLGVSEASMPTVINGALGPWLGEPLHRLAYCLSSCRACRACQSYPRTSV
jgi:hypothetical protein